MEFWETAPANWSPSSSVAVDVAVTNVAGLTRLTAKNPSAAVEAQRSLNACLTRPDRWETRAFCDGVDPDDPTLRAEALHRPAARSARRPATPLPTSPSPPIP